MIKRTTIIEIITVLNIILFLYTGIAKIQEYSVFMDQLRESPFLAPVSKAIAIFLPIVEFFVVIMLAIPRWRSKGLKIALVLIIVFTCYIIWLFTFNKELPCSCGGIIEELSWKQHLTLNGILIALNISGIILQQKVKNQLAKEWKEVKELEMYHN